MATRDTLDAHAGTGCSGRSAGSAGRLRCARERLGNRGSACTYCGIRPGVARRAMPGRPHRVDPTCDSRRRRRARRRAGPFDADSIARATQRAIVVIAGGSSRDAAADAEGAASVRVHPGARRIVLRRDRRRCAPPPDASRRGAGRAGRTGHRELRQLRRLACSCPRIAGGPTCAMPAASAAWRSSACRTPAAGRW